MPAHGDAQHAEQQNQPSGKDRAGIGRKQADKFIRIGKITMTFHRIKVIILQMMGSEYKSAHSNSIGNHASIYQSLKCTMFLDTGDLHFSIPDATRAQTVLA